MYGACIVDGLPVLLRLPNIMSIGSQSMGRGSLPRARHTSLFSAPIFEVEADE